MLTIIEIQNREQIKAIQDQFDPECDTWIVSDLKSKLDIQNQILKKNNSYSDQSVLRISDLWQKILYWKAPHLKIISEDFARILVSDFLLKYKNQLDMNDKNLKSIFNYIHLFAPIIFHSRGQDQILEWFEQNPNSAIRWKKWYLIAQLCVKYLLEEKNVICRPWIASYLQNEINLNQFWQRKIFVDLGSELSKVEAQLLRQFKQTNELVVICPKPNWDDQFKYLKSSYDELYSAANTVQRLTNKDLSIPKKPEEQKLTKQIRFSGMLSEIKHVVSQVRLWLEQGVQANAIGIIASNIESYWPILHRYFEIEGIPIQKDTTVRLIGFQNVNQWLSQLRLSAKQNYKFSDFSQLYYTKLNENTQPLNYEKFKSLFSQIFSFDELSYFEKSGLSKSAIYGDAEIENNQFTRDQFIRFAISTWSSAEYEHLEIIINEVITMADPETVLELNSWIEWIENIAIKKELSVEKGSSEGVQLVKIQAAHSADLTHRIFLNLSEESLKISGAIHLNQEDYFNLNKDLGFCLYHPDQSQLEYELLFITEMTSAIEDHYCFSQTDLSGQLLTPSQFWLKFGDQHQLAIPQLTRFDEIQHLKTPNKNADLHRLEMDYNQTIKSEFKWKDAIRLSPTAIEEYHQCPFIFAAKKYFYLEDEAVIDLDADPRTNGVIIHKIFEKAIQQKLYNQSNHLDEHQFIEGILIECDFKISAQQMRQIYIKKYVRILKKFIKFESEWRQKFAEINTIHCEVPFSFYLNLSNLEIRKKTSKSDFARDNEVLFTGKIDRIDQIGIKDLVVYDYKSSTDKFHQFKSWLQFNEFQLLIYILVIQNQIIEGLPSTTQVGGAFFYNVKKYDFEFGILRNDLQDRIGLYKNSFSQVAQETIDHYLLQLKEKLKIPTQKILAGELSPAPAKLLNCSNCKWSRLCRAVHLN